MPHVQHETAKEYKERVKWEIPVRFGFLFAILFGIAGGAKFGIWGAIPGIAIPAGIAYWRLWWLAHR